MTIEELKKRCESISEINKKLLDKVHKRFMETDQYTWNEFKDLTEMLKNITKVESFLKKVYMKEGNLEKSF